MLKTTESRLFVHFNLLHFGFAICCLDFAQLCSVITKVYSYYRVVAQQTARKLKGKKQKAVSVNMSSLTVYQQVKLLSRDTGVFQLIKL